MKLEQLERRLQIHQAFSGSIRSSLARLWNRPLTEAEGAVVDSGTLCCSFMGLETLDNKLTHATAASVADSEHSYLKETASRSRPDVFSAMERVANQLGVVLRESEGENLLTIEVRLIEDARERWVNP